jgi:hypothetical protein
MSRNESSNPKSQASNRPAANVAGQKQQAQAQQESAREGERRDQENRNRFTDQSGNVAQDLPDARHGQNAVDHPWQIDRNLPHQHGGTIGGKGGTRGDRDLGDADDHGGRKRN